MTESEKAVFDKAIIVLDVLVPDWFKHIDTKELNLSDHDFLPGTTIEVTEVPLD